MARSREKSSKSRASSGTVAIGAVLLWTMAASSPSTTDAFVPPKGPAHVSIRHSSKTTSAQNVQLGMKSKDKSQDASIIEHASKFLMSVATTAALSAAIFFSPTTAFAEDELAAKYGGKGFDSSLVDQSCLVNKCSLQAKACLQDDPSCRKGLTCTAKCMGDNACITGCMARYGDDNLDKLLKCTIEDNECIKVAILDGGADKLGQEPRPPAPTVQNFDLRSMEGTWYKVVGYNPNYDCYACQRNTFSAPEGGNMLGFGNDRLQVDVEFSMPRLLPDGSPPPPKNVRESISYREDDGLMYGSQSIGFNDYATHETMVFDNPADPASKLAGFVLGKGTEQEVSYARTAHSEGEMFGLKFWENWYVLGENDPGQPEFKFIYYNGKTRQNTYEGAFVYSRTRELSPEAMKKVYKIANDAGMNPDQFCKIRNGCFKDDTIIKERETGLGSPSNPFRGILASTKISQLLGVESVAAEGLTKQTQILTSAALKSMESQRAWWYEVGDYLENPHRHFKAMDSTRIAMDWPDFVKRQE